MMPAPTIEFTKMIAPTLLEFPAFEPFVFKLCFSRSCRHSGGRQLKLTSLNSQIAAWDYQRLRIHLCCRLTFFAFKDIFPSKCIRQFELYRFCLFTENLVVNGRCRMIVLDIFYVLCIKCFILFWLFGSAVCCSGRMLSNMYKYASVASTFRIPPFLQV